MCISKFFFFSICATILCLIREIINSFINKRIVAFSHKRRQPVAQKNSLSNTSSSLKQVRISPLSISIRSLHILVKHVNKDFRKKSSRKVDLVIYLPIYERILCLISGFSRYTDSARFNIKKRPEPDLIPCQTLPVQPLTVISDFTYSSL